MNMVQFNGFYGCPYCLEKGRCPEGLRNLVYPFEEEINLRNNTLIRKQMEEADLQRVNVMGIKGSSVLCSLQKFNLVDGIAIDYMHSVLLGVVKFMVSLWFDATNRGEKYHIASEHQVNARMLQIKLPRFTTRTIRPIGEREKFKANEWRTFFLIYSVPVLWNVLPQPYLNHYISLVSVVYTFLRDSVSHKEIDDGNRILHSFVKQFQTLYGERNMRFNVHLLLHLGRCVSRCGPLWAYSAFPFESGNGEILGLINGTRGVLEQISNRFTLLKRNDEILQENEFSPSVLHFCDGLRFFRRNQISQQSEDVTVLGKYSSGGYEERELILLKFLNIEKGNTETWHTLIVKGNLYHNYNYKRAEKTMDAFAELMCGRKTVIRKIISTPQGNIFIFTSTIMVERNVTHLPPHIEKCRLSDDLQLVSASEIRRKLVLVQFDNYSFVTEFPNSFETD